MSILDADKEGYLRSKTSLIQTIGRAARNVDSKVIMYADTVTKSMKAAINETERRREIQKSYNKKNGISPRSIKKNIKDILSSVYAKDHISIETPEFFDDDMLLRNNLESHLKELNKKMIKFAEDLDFENAAKIRDEIRRLEETSLKFFNDPMDRDPSAKKRRKRK